MRLQTVDQGSYHWPEVVSLPPLLATCQLWNAFLTILDLTLLLLERTTGGSKCQCYENNYEKGQKEPKFQINSALELGFQGKIGVQETTVSSSHDFSAKYGPLATVGQINSKSRPILSLLNLPFYC